MPPARTRPLKVSSEKVASKLPSPLRSSRRPVRHLNCAWPCRTEGLQAREPPSCLSGAAPAQRYAAPWLQPLRRRRRASRPYRKRSLVSELLISAIRFLLVSYQAPEIESHCAHFSRERSAWRLDLHRRRKYVRRPSGPLPKGEGVDHFLTGKGAESGTPLQN